MVLVSVTLPATVEVVTEHLPITGLRAPEVDAAELLDTVEVHVRSAAVGVGASDQPDLVSEKLEAGAGAGCFGDVQFAARGARRFLDRPGALVLQSIVLGGLLRIVARDNHVAVAVVPDGHDAIAVGQRLQRIAVFRKPLPLRQGTAVGQHRMGPKSQTEQVFVPDGCTERAVTNLPLAEAVRKMWFSRLAPIRGCQASIFMTQRSGQG